jgi:Tol biopolymer transport system component
MDYGELSNYQFSPDGKHILFVWGNLFLMDLETSLAERISKWEYKQKEYELAYQYPRFSHDGRQILFSTVKRVKTKRLDNWGRQEPKLWTINTDGTGLRSIDIKLGE